MQNVSIFRDILFLFTLYVFYVDGTISTVNSLLATNARQEWERIFTGHYISPILEKIQQVLNEAVDIIAKDDDQGTYSTSNVFF